MKTGNSLTITEGTWTGTPVRTYTMKRGSTPIVGPGASKAAAEAYTFVAADCGPTITVEEDPGGGGTASVSNALAYVLTNSGTLLVHVDAASGVEEAAADAAEDGDSVQFWRGLNSTPDFSQGTANIRPIYRATGGPLSGPAVEFKNVSSNIARMSATLSANAQPNTIYAVAKSSWGATANTLFDGAAGNRHIVLKSSTSLAINAGSTVTGPALPTADTWFYCEAIYDGASSSLRINNDSASTALNPSTNSWSNPIIGAQNSATANNTLDGAIARLVAFDGALSAADSADVRSFLSFTYGI